MIYLIQVFDETPPREFHSHTAPSLTDNGWLISLDDGVSFFTDANVTFELVPDI